MVHYIKKHAAVSVLILDGLILPGMWLCKWLIGVMLAGGKPCPWAIVGAQCGTCGGTHCVQSFLAGDLAAAFAWNPLVFCGILYVIATVILLNLCFLFKQAWAGKMLRWMYSLTAFLCGIGLTFVFTIVRNLPVLIQWLS